jgi:2-polyprenyl-3-methyl-5-hydroxy-6-metoxy-1,4-benzoquinol methylase
MTTSQPRKELLTYASFVHSIVPHIDMNVLIGLAEEATQYYKGSTNTRAQLRALQELEMRWYTSLADGAPDYSVYDDPYMLADVYACYVVYSSKYLALLQKPGTIIGRDESFINLTQQHARVVLDLGCGPGYTTSALRQLYPHAQVYGTQLATSAQWHIARALGNVHQFTVVETPAHISKPIDVVFASEFFEHLYDPFTELRTLVDQCNPSYFVIANSFNTISVGHFHQYTDAHTLVPAKDASRRFNAVLRSLGYTKIRTKFWNSRPTLWKKQS